ncbi:MAG: DUF4136 domain-containing protein [Bacillota bacterium]
MVSCSKYPPASSRLLEDLAVLTQYDVNTNFGLCKTYSIVDSIYYITGKDSSMVLTPSARLVLNQIIGNMNARGFKQVAKSAKPDLGINIAAIKTTTTTIYYPGWYWGYPGYYSPGWWGYGNGYYYPYYPSYYTSYSAGTLVMEMVNFKAITPSGQVPVVWDVFIRGLFTSTHTSSDVTGAIDQSFAQNPTIKTSL